MIAIYRHMKLAFAMHKPDLAYRAPPVRIDQFATEQPYIVEGGKGFLPSPIELTFINRTSPEKVQKLIWRFARGKFQTFEHTTEKTVQTWPKKEIIPPLVNMVWTDNGRAQEVFDMMDLMSNRCLVETFMHNYHPDWADFGVVEVNLNRKRDLTTPYMGLNAIRSKADLEIARATEPNPESAEEWAKLFMGE